jgi:hypothetical protein
MEFKRLVQDLKNPDEDIRIFACMSIINANSIGKNSAEKLFEVLFPLTQDDNICLRFYAKKALNRVKEFLTQYVSEQSEEETFFGLKELRDSVYIEYLKWFQEYVGESPPSISVNDLIEKLYKFCQYDQPEVLHILLKILERTGNAYIKATIIKILGYKKDKDLLLTLSQFLKDEDPRVRSNAVEAIERIGSKEGIKLLVPLLQDEDNRVKATVARALGKFGEEEVYTVLSQMLDSFELWMRESAVYALSELKTVQAKFLLLKALNDNSEIIKTKVIQSLRNYPYNDVIPHLERILQSKNHKLVEEAKATLEFIRLNLKKDVNSPDNIIGKLSLPREKKINAFPLKAVSSSFLSDIDISEIEEEDLESFEIPFIDDVDIEKRLSVDPKISKVIEKIKEKYLKSEIKDSIVNQYLIEIDRTLYNIGEKEKKLKELEKESNQNQILGWLDETFLKKQDTTKIKESLKRLHKRKEELIYKIGEHIYRSYKSKKISYADLNEVVIKVVKTYLEMV